MCVRLLNLTRCMIILSGFDQDTGVVLVSTISLLTQLWADESTVLLVLVWLGFVLGLFCIVLFCFVFFPFFSKYFSS